MSISQTAVSAFLSGVLILGVGGVTGQEFPTKPIRIITGTPGGTNDFMARFIAQGISGPLGQNVVVDNRSSAVVGELVAKAPPDGYTMLIQGSQIWLQQYMQEVRYDAVKDLAPITWASSLPSVLLVPNSLPAKTVKELIALAKAKPGELNYATGAIGSAQHLATELFNAMAGVKISRVEYRGTGPALTALLGGQEVQLLLSGVGVGMPYARAGKLRALAITSPQQSALAPDLPTVAASLPGYQSQSMTGIWAPAKTPEKVVDRLNREIVRFLRRPDVNEKLLTNGTEVVANSPKEFAVAMKNDMARMGKIIKDLGIRGGE